MKYSLNVDDANISLHISSQQFNDMTFIYFKKIKEKEREKDERENQVSTETKTSEVV